jgi:hypothetical protein
MDELKRLAYLANEKLIFPKHDPKYLGNYIVDVKTIELKENFERSIVIIRASIFDKNSGKELKWEGPLEEWYAGCAQAVKDATKKPGYGTPLGLSKK